MDDTPADTAQILTRLSQLGEYFSLFTERGDDVRPISELCERESLREFVDRTRAAIAASMRSEVQDIPLRLAASSFQLGVAARLLSPAIGAALICGRVPELTAASVTWQATGEHFARFGVETVRWADAGTPQQAATVIVSSVVGDVLDPLNEALRSTTALSPTVMSGNVVSAANGAVTVLAMSRPPEETRGRALVRALLDTDRLAGTGTFEHGRFVRRSCCLFYLAPHGGLCGDCVLAVS